MKSPEKNELKPCPFCGNNNLSIFVDDFEYITGLTDKANFKVVCNVPSKGCGTHTEFYPTKKIAIDEWNRMVEKWKKWH